VVESLEKVSSDARRGESVDAADIRELMDEKWYGQFLRASSQAVVPDADECTVPQPIELWAAHLSSHCSESIFKKTTGTSTVSKAVLADVCERAVCKCEMREDTCEHPLCD